MVDTVETAVFRMGADTGQYVQAMAAVEGANQRVVASTARVADGEERVQVRTQASADAYSRLEARYQSVIAIEQRRARALEQEARVAEELGVTEERRATQIAAVNQRYDEQIAKIQRLAQAQTAAEQAAERAAEAQRRANAALSQSQFNTVLGVRSDFNTAGRAADIVEYGRELDRLRARFVPLAAAQQTYRAQLDDLSTALRVGALNQTEYATALSLTKSAFAQQVTAINGATGGFLRNLAANRQWRTGIQQAGFQVGDFAVQVASGQNALVAFTQQGSQLLQVFGGPWGAVVGAAVSILGALALGFWRTRDATQAAREETEEFNRTYERLSSLMDEINGKTERTRSSMVAEVGNVVGVAELQFRNAEAELAAMDARVDEFLRRQNLDELAQINPNVRRNAEAVLFGRVTGNVLDEQRERVDALRLSMVELQAEAGRFDDGRARMGERHEASTRATEAQATATRTATATTRDMRIEADELGRSLDQLLNRLDPNRAATQEYARSEALLTLAFERGRLTADEYAEALRRLEAQMNERLSPSAERTAEGIERTTELMKEQERVATEKQAEIRRATDTVADGFGEFASSVAKGSDALETLGQVGERVLNALIDQFVELAFVNPLKNQAGGPQSPTLDSLISGGGFFASLFGSLFGGGSAAGYTSAGASVGATSSSALAGGQIGFAHGGEFEVGGSGGVDSQLVTFRATPGERVTVETPQQQRVSNDNRRTSVVQNFYFPPPVNGFGYSEQQMRQRAVERAFTQGRNV